MFLYYRFSVWMSTSIFLLSFYIFVEDERGRKGRLREGGLGLIGGVVEGRLERGLEIG